MPELETQVSAVANGTDKLAISVMTIVKADRFDMLYLGYNHTPFQVSTTIFLLVNLGYSRLSK